MVAAPECASYSVAEAARLLGVSPSTVRRWIKAGTLSVERASGRNGVRAARVSRDALDRAGVAAVPSTASDPLRPEILESITDACYVVDDTWRLRYVNRRAEQLWGRARDAILGRVLWEVFPRSVGSDPHAAIVQAAGERRAVDFQAYSTTLERWIEGTAAPIGDGLAVYFRDVSRRRRAEEAQRFLAEASRQLAGSLSVAETLATITRLAVTDFADWCVVDIVHDDGSIEAVSSAHRDPAREPLVRELQERFGSDRSVPRRARALETGETVMLAEVTDEMMQASARAPRHLELLRALAPSSLLIVPHVARGRMLGTIFFASSTPGRRYDDEDRRTAEDLAGRCALAIDNARLYEQARRALQVRDEFFSNVSHDLKTPLTTIKGIIQLLMRRSLRGEVDPQRLVPSLEKVAVTVDAMRSQIDDILDLTLLQPGQALALRLRPTDLVELARGVVRAHRRMTERHTIVFEAEVSALTATVDAPRIERVLNNLLDNALKYSVGGTVAVRVGREESAAGAQALLSVRDEGIGIPAADRERIFDRFHRAPNVQGRADGTGLGLTSAAQLVRQHGGTIAVESEEGTGSTFTVRLPLGPDAEEHASPEDAGAP